MSTDLLAENDRLEAQVLAAIAGAQDEAALEVVRIGALGKKGSISAMLATLGKMSPDERRTRGVEINALKDKVTDAIARRRTGLPRRLQRGGIARSGRAPRLVPGPRRPPGRLQRHAREAWGASARDTQS